MTCSLFPQVAVRSVASPGRQENQDWVGYHVPDRPEEREKKGCLFVIADGMGGLEGGQQASRMTGQLLLEGFYGDRSAPPDKSLEAAIKFANREVWAEANRLGIRRWGATLVAASVHGCRLVVASVGDSRAYLVHLDRMRQVTQDHSWVAQQVEAGLLSAAEIRRHPRRNIITRAVGIAPEIRVYFHSLELEAGDIIVLCSDGLWGRILDEEIMQVVLSRLPEEAAQDLVEMGRQRGEMDDISIVIVSLQAGGS